jgi:hypothetical protein
MCGPYSDFSRLVFQLPAQDAASDATLGLDAPGVEVRDILQRAPAFTAGRQGGVRPEREAVGASEPPAAGVHSR